MSSDGAMMPAVAPGTWTDVQTADFTREVRVSFESAQSPSAVVLQLDKWNASLSMANCSNVVLPTYIRRDATPMLHFAPPVRIGSKSPATTDRAAIVATLRTVALALDSLHSHGLVHGALAFPSLWWNANNQVQFPDAGLARALEGIVAASPDIYNYRAPELWHGRAPLPASDQYSLAVMAYELFTGRSRGTSAMVDGLVSIEPIMLEPKALHDAGAPAGIAEVLQRALSATPTSRYRTCVELIEAVAAQFGDDGLNKFADRRRRPRKRITTSMIAASVVAVAIIGGAAYAGMHQDETRALFARTQTKVRAKIEGKDGELLAPSAGTTVARAASGAGQAARRAERMARTTIETQAGASATLPRDPQSPSLQRGQLFSEVIRGPSPLPPPLRENANAPQLEDGFNIATNSAFSDAARNVSEFASSLVAQLDSATPAVRALSDGLTTANVSGTAAAILDAVKPGEIPTNSEPSSASRAVSTAATTAATGAATMNAAAEKKLATNTAKLTPPPPNDRNGAAASANTNSAKAAPGTTASTPPGRSTMAVISFRIPASSRLYVDGQLIRQRSKPLLVEPGIHDVVVLTDNGGSVKRRLTIAAGDTSFVRVP